jgi:hypothetical protein
VVVGEVFDVASMNSVYYRVVELRSLKMAKPHTSDQDAFSLSTSKVLGISKVRDEPIFTVFEFKVKLSKA